MASKNVIISGAGTGIGQAMAQKLAQTGYTCLLLGRNQQTLNQTLQSLPGSGHQVLIADVRQPASLAQAAASIAGLPIYALLANAGIGGENYWGEADRWDDILSTNLTGCYNFVNTFLPQVQQQSTAAGGLGQVLITSSVLARLGVANYSAYCASKAGLLGLMRSWAVQYAPQNILVNAICPGWVDTEMSQQGLQGIADGIGISKAEFFDIAMQSVPLRRMSQPTEIADLVAYLLSQTSITGQTIDINCGSVMNS